MLYAFILRRTELSRKNGWADEYGRIYLYYPICEVVDLLRCGRQKAVNTMRELQYAGLVEIQKQGCGKIITSELEAVVYQQMVKKLEKHKTLTGRKKAAKANPKIAALQVELLHVDSEIEKLVDSLTGANNVLLSYVNVKIAELDGRKQELVKQIAELTVETISPGQVNQISGYLDTWDDVSFDDKRRVVDLMITTVAATSDSLNITWKI